MTVGEIVQRVQSLYSHGVQSDDSRLSSRHIYSKMLSSRSRILLEDMKSEAKINPWLFQTIPCVELVEAKIHECDCIPPLGCLILKSKHRIPKPLNDDYQTYIQSVTSIDGRIGYAATTWVEKRYKEKGMKYAGGMPDYFIRNGYLYITWRRGPRVISITGIFEDPIEVNKFPSYCNKENWGNDCLSALDGEFPMELSKVDKLVEYCAAELIALFNQQKEDLHNDSKDENAQQ